jgi:tetratricopeptide (TPR) repeat protein
MIKSIKHLPRQIEINELVGHIENGQYEEAITKADLITKDFPFFQFGWKVLGIALQYENKLDKALNAHLQAVYLDKNDAEAYSNLGNCQSEIGMLFEAEISHKEAINLNPKYTRAYSNLGIVQQKLGKLEEALIIHEKAVSQEPDKIIFQYNLSLVYLELNNLKNAESCLKNVIAKKPDFSNAYSYLAIVLKKMGNVEEALKISNLSLQIDEYSFHANYTNATILYEIGELSISLEKLKKANEISNEIHTEVAIRNLSYQIKNSMYSKCDNLNEKNRCI